jgi:hypothetical protein
MRLFSSNSLILRTLRPLGGRFEQQAPLDQLGINGGEHLKSQVVGFKQVTESENGALISQACAASVELGELTKQGHIVQGLFHGRVTQAKLLLHEMDAKHCGNGKKGGRRVLLAGAKGLIKPAHSDQGTSRFVSSRNHAYVLSW